MACGKCGSGSRHNVNKTTTNTPNSGLKKFAYLTPRQLRLLAEQEGSAPEEDGDK